MHEHELAKYARRVKRFRCLKEGTGVLLFIRAVNGTSEIHSLHKLHGLLQRLFGADRVYLLVLLSQQLSESLILFRDIPTLLLYTFGRASVIDEEDSLASLLPLYTKAIRAAHDFVVCSRRCRKCTELASLSTFLEESTGLFAPGDFGQDLSKQFSPCLVGCERVPCLATGIADKLDCFVPCDMVTDVATDVHYSRSADAAGPVLSRHCCGLSNSKWDLQDGCFYEIVD